MVHIFELLDKKSSCKVLSYFLEHPSEETYPDKLLKKIRMARNSLFSALGKMEKFSILLKKQIGKTVIYYLNKDNPLVKQLKILFNVDKILSQIKTDNYPGQLYLYGSSARGEDVEKSDIDLLIITEKKTEALSYVSKIKDERIKPVIFTQLEYANIYRKDKAFYDRIEKDKIRLI